MKKRFIVCTASALVAATPSSYPLGIRIPNQDAEANARGNAFVATASNPSAIYYNPAGITQLKGHNLQGGVMNYLGINFDYESPAGNDSETEFEVIPVPQIHYVFTPEDSPLSYGIGLYAPFGLGIEWPDDTGFRTLALEGRVNYLTLNPVVAYKILPNLSIAAGPNINYSTVELRQGIGLVPGDEFRYEADDFGFGFNAGLFWQITDQWVFGASYRSGSTLNYRGESELRPFAPKMGSSMEVDYPQMASAGISFRPTPKWNFEVSADWTDWSSIDDLVIKEANPLAGGDSVLPLNWKSSWFYHVGATHYFENGFFASIGYFFSEDSTTERNYTPYVPDADIHVASLGGGYRGERWYFALAAQLFIGVEREVDEHQTTSLIGETANGKYTLLSPGVTFSLGHRF